MKVLFVGPSLDKPGGVANYCKLMVESFRITTLYHTIGRRLEESGRWSTVRRMVLDFWSFGALLRESKPDIIQLNPSLNFNSMVRDALLLRLCRRSDARTVVFFHGWNDALAERLSRPLLRGFIRWAMRPADAIVVLCTAYRDALIGMGVDAPIYVETVAVPDAAGTRAGNKRMDDGSVRVLFLSRLEEKKGVLPAVQAHKHLIERGHDVQLVVAGDGPYLKLAQEMVAAENIPGVVFTGFVVGEEKSTLLEGSSVFIFPSSYAEGLPTCVLEAMTYGLPVVTTSVGGIRDFFEDGKMGLVARNTEPALLADLLEKLIVDPSTRMAMSARNAEYAKRRFNAGSVAARLAAIYEGVADPTPRRADVSRPTDPWKGHR
ncbi:glycosyltransferase involved in cell wall biosynthesis [Paraburkholderia sp. BL6665CI2N2]|uniref:glycosyltransferase family 4 protein n=1 Tax=Paraburkholderia sp. BL6665CI2N2 TaxID=1938806 RepID=UPI00106475DA|nr:glycosyltransferase family 4 protein [Paraburkholderia sp. BL6665CI2N2]TDY16885.1 glycosyltransferase involved in cell wall biosynthesis [Paraburkholderia sp. BL6665CI2N2]